eukprot:6312004-Amphidinium_carterae.1
MPLLQRHACDTSITCPCMGTKDAVRTGSQWIGQHGCTRPEQHKTARSLIYEVACERRSFTTSQEASLHDGSLLCSDPLELSCLCSIIETGWCCLVKASTSFPCAFVQVLRVSSLRVQSAQFKFSIDCPGLIGCAAMKDLQLSTASLTRFLSNGKWAKGTCWDCMGDSAVERHDCIATRCTMLVALSRLGLGGGPPIRDHPGYKTHTYMCFLVKA